MIREDQAATVGAQLDQEYAPITLTAAAVQQLQRVMAEKGLADAGLRVFVSGGGCSGLQYGLAFVTEPEETDHVFSSTGLRVHVDPVSMEYVQGAHIDFQDSLMGGGFKIENPNAVSGCGCGQSFRPAGGRGGAVGGTGGGCGSGCG